ncbi:hypothetical protein ACFLQ2_03890 [archaeon]
MKKAALVLLLLLASVMAADLLTVMDNLDENMADQLDQRAKAYAAETARAAYDVNYNLLTIGPTGKGDDSSDLGSQVRDIVVAMAVVALAYFGMNYMLHARGANERNKAKKNMQNMLILIILAVSAIYIFDIVMGIETDVVQELTDAVSSQGMAGNPLVAGSWGANADDVLAENPFVTMVYALGLSVSALSLTIRWLFLDITRTLFPLFLALVFLPIDIAQGLGKILLKSLVVFIIIPFIDAVLIGSIASFLVLFPLASQHAAGLLVLSFAFVMVGLVNTLLPYMAIQFSSLTQGNLMSLFTQVKSRR